MQHRPHIEDGLTWTDDGRDDCSRNHDTANTKTSDGNDHIYEPEVIHAKSSHPTSSSCHQNAGNQDQSTNLAVQEGHQSEDDAGSGQDGEPEGDVANANTNGVVAVHIVALSRPEQDDTEETSSTILVVSKAKRENRGEDYLMAVMIRVNPRTRTSCLRRLGNIGNFAKRDSQTKKPMIKQPPKSRGTRT